MIEINLFHFETETRNKNTSTLPATFIKNTAAYSNTYLDVD